MEQICNTLIDDQNNPAYWQKVDCMDIDCHGYDCHTIKTRACIVRCPEIRTVVLPSKQFS
eukprot:11619693-Karenia_brevis.AAC.1